VEAGDLCKVKVSWTHSITQLGDMILILKCISSGRDIEQYYKGFNLKTRKMHHYKGSELEVINEAR
jgi:hypothetical protein